MRRDSIFAGPTLGTDPVPSAASSVLGTEDPTAFAASLAASIAGTVPTTLTEALNRCVALTLEAGATVLTYELYPLGVLPKRVPALPRLGAPKWGTDSALGTEVPVLFIHGVFHNPATFACLKQRLTWAGWTRFHEVNLLHSLRSIPSNAARISRIVNRLRREYRVPHIDIVAHSMGGILARYYVQRLGGDGKVRNLITLGTPHKGTGFSRFALFPYLRELAPASTTMRLLEKAKAPKHTRILAVSGELDPFTRRPGIVPNSRAKRKAAAARGTIESVELSNVGHAGLLFSRRVAQIVVNQLSDASLTEKRPR